MAALQRTIDALSRLARAEDFIPAVLHIVADAFGAKSCAFCEHPDETIYLRYWWHEGRVLGPTELPDVDPAHFKAVRRLAFGFTAPFSHLGVDLHRRSEPSLIEHRRGTGDSELQSFACSMGWDRELNVPLVVDARAIGGLVIYRSDDAPFGAGDVALGAALGKQLALAMQVSKLAQRERERAQADEAASAAEERAALMDHAVSAMRRCSDALLDVDEPRGAIVAALRAAADILASLGIIEAGLIELSLPARTVRCNLLLRDGELQDIEGSAIDRHWPIDEYPMNVVWKRASEGAPFVWGLTSDTTVLVPEARTFHEAMGARAVGYVPLERAGEAMGWIAMSFREPVPPSEHQISLVRALSAQVFLAIELERIARQSREAALAKDREVAERHRASSLERERAQIAQAHLAELAKVNDALRSSVDALAASSTIEEVHCVFLREAMRVTEAQAGAILTRLAHTTEFDPAVIHADGQTLMGSSVTDSPLAREIREVSRLDRSGYFAKLADGEALWRHVESDPARDLPLVTAYHLAAGRSMIWDLPFRVRGVVHGYLSLVFDQQGPLSNVVGEAMNALATQVGLTLEMKRLSEAARDAAVAREREAAAELRTAGLAATNAALTSALTKLAREPVHRAPEVLLVEVARAADAALCYWIDFDASNNTLEVTLRIEGGRLLNGPSADEPDIFRAAFPADTTAAFETLCREEAFATICSKDEAPLMWPGTLAWHRRHGREEALAFALKIGDEPLGLVGMAFTRAGTMQDPAKQQFVRAMANQFALAVQLGRVASQAALAAIARELEHERARAAEQHAEQLGKSNATLRRVNARLAGAPDLPGFLGRLVEEACSATGLSSGCAFLLDDTASHLVPVRGFEDGRVVPMLRDFPYSARTPLPISQFSAWEALRLSRRPIELSVDGEDGHPVAEGTRAWHLARGNRTVVVAPMMLGSTPRGLLALCSDTAVPVSVDVLEIVGALAQQATLAVELTRLSDEAKHAATSRAVSEERNRMAGEIHDSLAQSFTSIAMQSEAVISDLDDHSPLRATLELIEDTARLGLAEARSSVLALRPIGDQIGDLETALEQLAARCNITGSVACEFHARTTPRALSPDVRDAVLRVAQEAVNNALRHAGAQRLVIEFDAGEDVARLTVTDDGTGLPVQGSARPGGFGIEGMRARAEALGGTLTLGVGSSGRGTSVRMSVPSPRAARAEVSS